MFRCSETDHRSGVHHTSQRIQIVKGRYCVFWVVCSFWHVFVCFDVYRLVGLRSSVFGMPGRTERIMPFNERLSDEDLLKRFSEATKRGGQTVLALALIRSVQLRVQNGHLRTEKILAFKERLTWFCSVHAQ